MGIDRPFNLPLVDRDFHRHHYLRSSQTSFLSVSSASPVSRPHWPFAVPPRQALLPCLYPHKSPCPHDWTASIQGSPLTNGGWKPPSLAGTAMRQRASCRANRAFLAIQTSTYGRK
jgi:hypothetical protein